MTANRRGLIRPTYSHNFARYAGESERPEEWRGLVGIWEPNISPPGIATGEVVRGIGPRNINSVININATLSTWIRDGEQGYVINYDGTTYIQLGSTALGITDYPFTFTAWCNPSDSIEEVLVCLADSSVTNVQYAILVTGSDATIWARNTSVRQSGTVNVMTGWHYIVGVFENATARHLYVDGVFDVTNTVSVSIGSGVNDMEIGRFGDSTPGGNFHGEIGQVRIYNRVLSAAEIRQQYDDRFAAVRLKRSPIVRVPVAGENPDARAFIPRAMVY